MLRRPAITLLDAQIERGRSPDVPIGELIETLQTRMKAQADSTPYFAGAQVLIDRGEYNNAITLAEHGVPVAERFIQENLGAFQMEGKAEGALMRSRAQAADIVGWALYMKKDYAGAATKLEEAERLYRGDDFNNQFHLAELARAQKQSDRAREHYLNALSLTAGPPPARERATQALTDLYAAGQKKKKPFTPQLYREGATRGIARCHPHRSIAATPPATCACHQANSSASAVFDQPSWRNAPSSASDHSPNRRPRR